MLLSSTVLRVVTFSLLCTKPSRYCIEYKNGTLHDVLTFELIVVISGVFAIFGYLRASTLFKAEQDGTNVNHSEEREDEGPMLVSAASNSDATENESDFIERRDIQMT